MQTGMSRITPYELTCQCFFRWESSLIKHLPLKAYAGTHSITKLLGWSMFLPWEPLPAQLALPRPTGHMPLTQESQQLMELQESAHDGSTSPAVPQQS